MADSIKTKLIAGDALKQRIIEYLSQYIEDEREDVETGLEEGIYDPDAADSTNKRLDEIESDLEKFKAFRPEIYCHVYGGLVQGAHANCEVGIEVFDEDQANTGNLEDDKAYTDDHGTIDEWDSMLKEGEANSYLKPVL